MQMAVIEAARNLAGLSGAGSTEFAKSLNEWPRHPVIA
jgi:CTP synthase (UTP-ammonia lyase)